MEKPTVTPEDVWADLLERDRQRQENERYLNEKFAETDKLFKESNANFDRMMAESNANFDRMMAESKANFDQMMKDADKRMKKVEETMGSWANNHGSFAEEYFFNAFENGQKNFFGEDFDEIERNVKGIKKGFKDEYDILFINGQSIGIVETKFKAHENDIPKVIRKSETFRTNFPEYKNHKVYLGLASLVFLPKVEQDFVNQGIVIIKQVGDTVIIRDEHLKSF